MADRVVRRPDGALTFVDQELGSSAELLLDTTVYLDVLTNRAPAGVHRLMERGGLSHSSVVIGELAQAFGRLEPNHPRTASALAELAGVFEDIPSRRLSVPSVRAFAEAGMLAGLAARLGAADSGPSLFNDALLLLHACETGRVVLTRNIGDFDVLQQLLPDAQVLLYRRS